MERNNNSFSSIGTPPLCTADLCGGIGIKRDSSSSAKTRELMLIPSSRPPNVSSCAGSHLWIGATTFRLYPCLYVFLPCNGGGLVRNGFFTRSGDSGGVEDSGVGGEKKALLCGTVVNCTSSPGSISSSQGVLFKLMLSPSKESRISVTAVSIHFATSIANVPNVECTE